MAKLLTSDNITQLEQSIYDNYNEVYRILCSDSTANQHVKQEYSNNEFEKLDPQVIGCQHIDIPEIQSEAFEEFDAEIIENIDVVINDCDKDLLEQTITLIGWEKLYKLIQLVLIKFDTYPKNYTKDDFEDLLKIILQIYQITHNIDDKIQSIEKTTLESQIKIGYLESFLYDDKGFTPPLKLEIKQDLSLKEVGIPRAEEVVDSYPFELSGGEKRRVAIAGIIASKPDILILDEPTAGLDPQGAKEMMQLFSNIHKSGVTIVLVTHDMDIVLEYASDVIVVQDGEIKEHCSPVKLFSKDNYEQYCLETPIVFKTAKLLISNGLKIDLSKINNIKSLAAEIVKAKKVNKHE